ncbi:hypothetical protein ES707_00946 [subsurface metagenome]
MATSQIGKVFAVDEVQVRIVRTEPPWLLIHAVGRVPTTGWSNGQLSKHVYVTSPADGIQGFDFVAQMPAPDQIMLDVLTPISAQLECPKVDLANYWGQGIPLKGVRVHAVSNAKTVEMLSFEASLEAGRTMSPRAVASYVGMIAPAAAPGFEQDIKPLFRPRDVTVMQSIAEFNLHNYDDVKTNADRILRKLRINMPCDGLWPPEDIAKFEAWKNGGMPA